MRDIQILQQILQSQCPHIHKKDLKLRHALETKTTVKHAIKRIDRPFGNHQQNRGKKLFVKDMQVLLHMLTHIPSLRIIGLMFDAARIH